MRMAGKDSKDPMAGGERPGKGVVVLAPAEGRSSAVILNLLQKRGLRTSLAVQPEEVMVMLARLPASAVIAVEPRRIARWNELKRVLDRYYSEVAVGELVEEPEGPLRLTTVWPVRGGEAACTAEKATRDAMAVEVKPELGEEGEADDIETGRLTHDELAMLLGGDWD